MNDENLADWNREYIWACVQFFGGIILMAIGWHLLT